MAGGFADYGDFGTRLSPTPTPLAPSFTGYEHDAYTGLEYAKNRYYDPATASFISSDPYPMDHSDLLGANLYNYVQGNPVNSTDPLGWFNWGTRTVEYGDTVNSIAESWGISPNIIYSRNPQIASARAIFPGQYVSLPVCDNAKCQETLVKWTAIHDATVPTICDKNGTVAQYVKSCAEPSQTLENAISILLARFPLNITGLNEALGFSSNYVLNTNRAWDVFYFYGKFFNELGLPWNILPEEYKTVYALMKPIGVTCVDLPSRWDHGDEAIVGSARPIKFFEDPINLLILGISGVRLAWPILSPIVEYLCANDFNCTNEIEQLTQAACSDGQCENEVSGGLNVFQVAARYGIRTYAELKRLLGTGSGYEVHHVIEKRFLQIVRISNPNITNDRQFPSVVLTELEHPIFTQLWKVYIPYDNMANGPLNVTTSTATANEVWQAAQIIYARHPELLNAASMTLFNKPFP